MEKHQMAYDILRKMQVEVAKTLDYIGEALCALKRSEKHKGAFGILHSFDHHLGMGNSISNWGLALGDEEVRRSCRETSLRSWNPSLSRTAQGACQRAARSWDDTVLAR